MQLTLEPPVAEKTTVNIGYLPLTDSAPLVVAQELGFFNNLGLNVQLQQEVSWANVRDKLTTGALDAAQMLAPLPAMTTLGVSGLRIPMLSGHVLSHNGNAITLSTKLPHNPVRTDLLNTTLAVVHGFSTHILLLHRWLASLGLDPKRDVTTIVVPPSQMVDSLAEGVIDGYCVGEPWNTVAVNKGVGRIVAAGCEVWPMAPEKVLCVTRRWHQNHPATHLRLRLALMLAGNWLKEEGNRIEVAAIVADKIGITTDEILPSLTGRLVTEHSTTQLRDFLIFNDATNCGPDLETTADLIQQSSDMMGKSLDVAQARNLAEKVARTDLYTEARRMLR